MAVLFAQLFLAQAQPDGFTFWNADLQKAVIYCLTGLGGLFVAWGLFFGAKTWKLRRMTEPQRRAEDGWRRRMEEKSDRERKALEDRLNKELEGMKQRMVTFEGLQRTDVARTESAIRKVDDLSSQVEDLSEYTQRSVHALRDEMNVMQGRLLNEFGELAVGVGRVEGTVTEISKSVGLAMKLWMDSRA